MFSLRPADCDSVLSVLWNSPWGSKEVARDIHHLLAKTPQEDSLLTQQRSTTEDDNAWILFSDSKIVYAVYYLHHCYFLNLIGAKKNYEKAFTLNQLKGKFRWS